MKNCFVHIFFFLSLSIYSQQWEWARSIGGIETVNGNGVSVDQMGNVIVVGDFEDISISFDTTVLYTKGYSDMYLAKYDASGKVIWAISDGGRNYDRGKAVCTDLNNNVFVAGCFSRYSIIGSDTLLIDSTGADNMDIFLVKYDQEGKVLWTKSAGGNLQDEPTSVCSDPNGNVIISGYFRSQSIKFGDTVLFKTGFTDIFLAMYDASGNLLWAKCGGLGSNDGLPWVSSDRDGNILMTGKFFNQLTVGSYSLIGAGTFLVKYDNDGTVVWATKKDGRFSPTSITTDGDNNIFVTGREDYSRYGFCIKYDASGNILWDKSAWANSELHINSATTDKNNNFVVTGYFSSYAVFDSVELFGPSVDGALFLVKFSSEGKLLFANCIGSQYDRGNSVATDASNNIYLVGTCRSPFILGTDTLYNSGYGNMLLAKLVPEYTGMDEQSDKMLFQIYPNPSSGIFTLKGEITPAKISVHDVLGNCVWNKEYRSEADPKIDLSDQPKGIYFVEICSPKKRTTAKIILE